MIDHDTLHDQAWNQVAIPAVATGLVSTATTLLGGRSGIEAVLRQRGQAGLKQALQPVWRAFFKGAVKENLEELPDELLNQISTALAKDPNADLGQVVTGFIERSPELMLAIGALGGAGEASAAKAVNQATPPAPAPRPPPAGDLFRQMEAADLTLSMEGSYLVVTGPNGAKTLFNSAEEAVAGIQARLQEENGGGGVSTNTASSHPSDRTFTTTNSAPTSSVVATSDTRPKTATLHAFSFAPSTPASPVAQAAGSTLLPVHPAPLDPGIADFQSLASSSATPSAQPGTTTTDSLPNGAWELEADVKTRISATAKELRPPVETYMSPQQIESHRKHFAGGASRLMPSATFDKYGPAQIDGTSFVISHADADSLLSKYKGNKRALEFALGLPDGFLESATLVRIDVPEPQKVGLRVPQGTEAGASKKWLPGGKLPDGVPEAVVDLGKAPKDTWKKYDLKL